MILPDAKDDVTILKLQAEIERLRDVERGALQQIEDMEGEIERLRADEQDRERAIETHFELVAENERLLANCKDKAALLKDAYTQNARLRAALLELSKHGDVLGGALADIVRPALEGK